MGSKRRSSLPLLLCRVLHVAAHLPDSDLQKNSRRLASRKLRLIVNIFMYSLDIIGVIATAHGSFAGLLDSLRRKGGLVRKTDDLKRRLVDEPLAVSIIKTVNNLLSLLWRTHVLHLAVILRAGWPIADHDAHYNQCAPHKCGSAELLIQQNSTQ